MINNSVEQKDFVSFWSTPSLISVRSYSAPVLPSVLLHLWQPSSVRKLWSIWSTNYALCAMITWSLQHSGNYATCLHFPEVCAVTCHPSQRTLVAFCSMADLLHAVRVVVDPYVSCYLLTAAFHGMEFTLLQERMSMGLPSSESHRGGGFPCVSISRLGQIHRRQIQSNPPERFKKVTTSPINRLSKVTEFTRHRQCWNCSEMRSKTSLPALAQQC